MVEIMVFAASPGTSATSCERCYLREVEFEARNVVAA